MISTKLVPLFVIALSTALYDPSLVSNWRLLVPDLPSPKNAVSSLPFPLGIVTQPFLWVDGRWEPPCRDEIDDFEEDELPSKSADIHQISIGQVLRPVGKNGKPHRRPHNHGLDREEDKWNDVEPFDPESPECSDSEPEMGDHDFDLDLEYSDYHGETERVLGGPVNVVPEHRLSKREKRVYETRDFANPVKFTSCTEEDTLVMLLDQGVLRDPQNRIGLIVGNHQFQFDGPTPQYGTRFAAGWLVTEDSLLSLGDQTTFFQCLAGKFHKTYDTQIHDQCVPVYLEVVRLEGKCWVE